MNNPKCEQNRTNCFSYSKDDKGVGRCFCLNNTKFTKSNGEVYKCPFYKRTGHVDEGQYSKLP